MALRPFLGFRRLDDRVGAAVRRTLDDDEAFRNRVREAVVEATGGVEEARDELGEAGWLLLTGAGSGTGPDADRLSELLSEAVSRQTTQARTRDEKREERRREQAEASLARLREDLAVERRRAEEQAARIDALSEDLLSRESELEALRAELAQLAADRSEAVRQLDDARRKIEERAEERKALRHAAAAAKAEASELRVELAHLRTEIDDLSSLPRFPPGGDATGRRDGPSPHGEDREELGRAIADAASAAAALGASLDRAARSLGDEPEGAGSSTPPEGEVGPPGTPSGGGSPRGRGSAASVADGGDASDVAGSSRVPLRRQPARLPTGVFDDSADAAAYLVRLPGVVLVVDGYNVSMAAWPDRPLAHQRRRLVEELRNLQARTGAEPVPVFDGADVASGPTGSLPRSVQVRFSPPGVTADDLVVELVERYPNDRAVVVVTSDRELRGRAEALGANVMSSSQLIGLLGV